MLYVILSNQSNRSCAQSIAQVGQGEDMSGTYYNYDGPTHDIINLAGRRLQVNERMVKVAYSVTVSTLKASVQVREATHS